MASLLHDNRNAREIRVDVHSRANRIDADLRQSIEQIVQRAFRRYRQRVGRIHVWCDDLNGPRGGIDTICRIQVQLTAGGTLIGEFRADSVYAALSGAIESAKTTIDRRVKRRRMRARLARTSHKRRGEQPDLQRASADDSEWLFAAVN